MLGYNNILSFNPEISGQSATVFECEETRGKGAQTISRDLPIGNPKLSHSGVSQFLFLFGSHDDVVIGVEGDKMKIEPSEEDQKAPRPQF